jgi:AAA15 family ATPase/GTPase
VVLNLALENKNGAQLIFSTHNTELLNIKEVFRRDQIWFIEKDKTQATVLYPLTEFNPRKDAAVESGYLTGKYGAVPFLSGFALEDSAMGNI